MVSSKGLEGIDAAHGEHVLLADTAEEYLACLEQLRNDDFPQMGGRARERIGHYFDWDQNLPEVVYLLTGQPLAEPAEKVSA